MNFVLNFKYFALSIQSNVALELYEELAHGQLSELGSRKLPTAQMLSHLMGDNASACSHMQWF